MKMRKLVALVSALLMLCCIIPVTVAADGNSATIDFTDKANRVSYSTEQQVWAQNGITVTNDKGASTSNVGDYGGEGYPVRFYKSSTVTVEYVGMTQIVFNCDDYKASYPTDLAASISGADVSVDGTVVTVTLSAPADSFVIEQLAAQVRVGSITVYGEGGGDTPVEPPVEPDEPDQPDTPDEPDEPDTPVEPADSAVLDFTTLDNRVSCSTASQVWKQNGITFTNDKGASTSNVNEKYYNPVRCYKSSTVTIEYPGMTKIVIDSVTYDDNDYAVGWTNSFTADATATVVDGNVTILLAEPADVFVWEKLTAQSRAYTITVYTGEGGGETPVEPPVEPSDDPEADTELSVADAIALGLSKEHDVFTEAKYYVTGVITEVYNTQYGNMRLTDEAGNILTIYGSWNEDGTVRYDALEEAPVAGDTVVLYGVIGQYNGTPQMKDGWIMGVIPGEGGGDPVDPPVEPDPDVPVTPDDDIDTTIPYLFGMVQENVSTEDVYFLDGGMNGYYMTTTTDEYAAIEVWLESTDGGYYLYALDENDDKLYINMVPTEDGAHVNGAYESTASTVYTYDWDLWTLVSEVNGDVYAFGTRNDRNYTTMGPVKVSYNGFHADLYYFSDEEECSHEYETETIEPTCGEDGLVTYTCPLCGDWYEETIPATGEHTYDDDYDADCNVCGDIREVPEKPVYVGSIVASTVEGSVGDTVDVTVSLTANPGIVSAKVKVYFDSTVLKFVGFTEGSFALGGYSTSDPAVANANGYFIINWCDAIHPNSTADLLATLTFEVLEGAADGLSAITLEFNCAADMFNANDETVWFEAENGGVQVVTKSFIAGDADGNGKVNNRDLGRLQQFLNNYEVTVDEIAVDMDGNGKLNNRDLGMLQQLLNSGVN